MKPVTGKTKLQKTQNRVSIQLTLSGHSFSPDSLRDSVDNLLSNGVASYAEIEVLTEKTQLVPREAFAEEAAGAFLRIAGLGCTPNEVPVWSDPAQPVVAVMAADARAVEILQERLSGRIRFVSPLLTEPECPSPSVWFCMKDELLYIKVYDVGLQFAEVVPCADNEDFRFLLERLTAVFSLKDFTAIVTGESGVLRSLVKRYFKRTICA